jgi:hypothetical protein
LAICAYTRRTSGSCAVLDCHSAHNAPHVSRTHPSTAFSIAIASSVRGTDRATTGNSGWAP